MQKAATSPACCTVMTVHVQLYHCCWSQTLMWMQYGHTVYMCYTRGSRVAEEIQHDNCVAAVEGRLDVNAACKFTSSLPGRADFGRRTVAAMDRMERRAITRQLYRTARHVYGCCWRQALMSVSRQLHIAIERRHTTAAAGRLAAAGAGLVQSA